MPIRILLANDHVIVREGLRALLEQAAMAMRPSRSPRRSILKWRCWTSSCLVRYAMRRFQAELARARYNLTQTILTAPIAGIVTTVAAQVGEKVHDGTTVVDIVDLPNPDYKFQPGFTARVELSVKQEALK